MKRKKDIITPVVKKIIDDWDPLLLLEMGAPKDEYIDVIQRIAAGLRHCNAAVDVQELIYNVFKECYGEVSTGDKDQYLKVAVTIFNALKKA